MISSVYTTNIKNSTMKRICTVLILFSIVICGFSQDGNLKTQTYFRVGYSLPTWKYGRYDWQDGTKRVGGLFEVGNIFMLNAIKLAPGMRIGINVDYLSIDYNQFKVDDQTYDFFCGGSKIGPSFSYSPVKRLVFDTYFKINPVWIDGVLEPVTHNTEDENDFYFGFMGLKYSVGLNVRYSVLMMGFEYNPGNTKMRWFSKDNGGLTDEYYGNANDNGKKTPVPNMHFTLGLSF
jgi:hypothetical protein